jgi:hypothetical protein
MSNIIENILCKQLIRRFYKNKRELGNKSLNVERDIISVHWQINKIMIKGCRNKDLYA